MDERVKFIAAYMRGELTMSELCVAFAVSRKTAYKWLNRYVGEGVNGLVDLSRRPHASPGAVTEQVASAIVNARKRKPRWGPKKLTTLLAQEFPGLKLPALSTIGAILKRRGLTQPRRRMRRVVSPYGQPFRGYDAPNAVWCADFKGHFAMGDGKRCFPLTISDGHTRFLIRCEGLVKQREDLVRAVFESAFREHGLPQAIRTDNGAPFSTLAVGGLSNLSVWWIRLGIAHERIEPGRPDQNGRHERMHRTLKAETANPPSANMVAQQLAFDLFRREYNTERPHEALEQRTPGSLYVPSPRLFPEILPDPQYSQDVVAKRVTSSGMLHWQGCTWYVSWIVRDELIGIRDLGDDQSLVQFGPVELGILDKKKTRLTKPGAKPYGSMQPMGPYRLKQQPREAPNDAA